MPGLMRNALGPAHVHADQHLGPVLALGAAGAGVGLEVAVVAVGLAREQGLQARPPRPGGEPAQRRDGVVDHLLVALLGAELGELDVVGKLALELPATADRGVEPGTLAHYRLRGLRVVPQRRILGARVQRGEPLERRVPVKDASSAAPATA